MDLLKNLLLERVKSAEDYDWYKYNTDKPMTIGRASKMYTLRRGVEFGTRPSTDGKKLRLIFKSEGESIVFTIEGEELSLLMKRSVAIAKEKSTTGKAPSDFIRIAKEIVKTSNAEHESYMKRGSGGKRDWYDIRDSFANKIEDLNAEAKKLYPNLTQLKKISLSAAITRGYQTYNSPLKMSDINELYQSLH